MEFRKYPSLTNHYREKEIALIKQHPEYQQHPTWIATEKVHGANCQLTFDRQGNYRPGSRNQFVDDEFYNAGKIFAQYKPAVIELFDLLNEWHYDTVQQVTVFGELFGGFFPGETITGKKIQSGVAYIPYNDFIMFDVQVTRIEDGETITEFEPWYDLMDYSEEIGFRLIPELARGSLNEMLDYPNDKDSVIPEMYDYEPPKDNTMEGIVIRPVAGDMFFSDGSRAIVKSKNSKFSEKTHAPKKPKVQFDHPLKDTVAGYVNENRLDAVLSKEGGIESLTAKDFGRVLGLMANDVMEDLIKDEVLPADWKKHDDLKGYGKFVNDRVREFLMENFMSKV